MANSSRFITDDDGIEADLAALKERNARRDGIARAYLKRIIDGKVQQATGKLTGDEAAAAQGENQMKAAEFVKSSLNEWESLMGRPAAHAEAVFDAVPDAPGNAVDNFIANSRIVANGYNDSGRPSAALRGITGTSTLKRLLNTDAPDVPGKKDDTRSIS